MADSKFVRKYYRPPEAKIRRLVGLVKLSKGEFIPDIPPKRDSKISVFLQFSLLFVPINSENKRKFKNESVLCKATSTSTKPEVHVL